MIKTERVSNIGRNIQGKPSIYNISSEKRNKILKNIDEKINGDMKDNQHREGESVELAEEFIPRPRL